MNRFFNFKMRVSKKTIPKNQQEEICQILYQVLADIENEKEAEMILNSLLSKTEILGIAKKVAIIKALKEKRSYNQIKQDFNVSSATISKIANQLKKEKGLILILKKIEAEQWAEKWASKIKKLFS